MIPKLRELLENKNLFTFCFISTMLLDLATTFRYTYFLGIEKEMNPLFKFLFMNKSFVLPLFYLSIHLIFYAWLKVFWINEVNKYPFWVVLFFYNIGWLSWFIGYGII